ncbi:MAG: YihY/virulence factor BrkB family protein [Thermoleophilaceae bacterium]|nr:YihY/virulence factor BrkB family protein [Thermoleophilaceae bacterium]
MARPAPPGGHARGRRRRRAWRAIAYFYRKAYGDNITGLSGMVAYNLLLSIFPLALLALFVAGRVLRSPDVQASVLRDLTRLFPSAAESTLRDVLKQLRDSSTGVGIGALLSSIWIGSSFWGALDTAFCRIYHVKCRSWVEQKRFSLAMLVVVLLFMAATVALPTLQSLVASSASDLPFGLSTVERLVYALSIAAGLVITFSILCVIYWAVPNRLVPWRAIWPGALLATFAIAVVDWAFPLYLGNISTIAHLGTTFVFVLILLVWFYVLAIILLAGAVVNAMRFEYHDTGDVTLPC